MNKIIDVEKIGEKGKIEISQLKIVLKEMIAEVKDDAAKVDDYRVDVSLMLALLKDKKLITDDEYERLKDNAESIVENQDDLEDLIGSGEELSDEIKDQIVKGSDFKGYFATYKDLIKRWPNEKVTHGDYAFIKDFSENSYNVNKIHLYIFDISKEKWMLGSDTTYFRNYEERFEEDKGRDGSPLDRDVLCYDNTKKRWYSMTLEEANVAAKEDFDHHTDSMFELAIDESTERYYLLPQEGVDKEDPSHLSEATLKMLIKQGDLHEVEATSLIREKDIINIERLKTTGKSTLDNGRQIRKHLTDETMNVIIDLINEDYLRTFNLKIEPNGRILQLDYDTPEGFQVPQNVRPIDINKVIKRANDDYFNTFAKDDIEISVYEKVFGDILLGYNDYQIDAKEADGVLARCKAIYDDKKLWDNYLVWDEDTKNKNVTPEIMNLVVEKLNYLHISKDIIRDEIIHRDVVFDGDKTYTGNTLFTNKFGHWVNDNRNIDFTNTGGAIKVASKKVDFTNDKGETTNAHSKVELTNKEALMSIQAKRIDLLNKLTHVTVNSLKIDITHPLGLMTIEPTTIFNGNVTFNKDVLISDSSKVFEVKAQTVLVKDNVINLNHGEVGDGVTYKKAGMMVDRGNYTNFFFGYSEDKEALVSGFVDDESDIEINTLNPLLSRDIDKNLNINKPLIWDGKKAITSDHLTADITGTIKFDYIQKDHDLDLLNVVLFDGDKLELASTESLEKSEAIGVVTAVDGDKVTVAISGLIPHQIKGLEYGTTLYLQPSGLLGDNDSHIITKEIGTLTPMGIIINIKKEVSISNIYTSYQDTKNLTILDSVRLNDGGELEKSFNTSLETSEVFGVVAKVTDGSIQCVTNGFIEADVKHIDGTLLFLQADGSLGPNKVGIVEKAIAMKVPRGIYVDVKLGIERKPLFSGTSKRTPTEKTTNNSIIEFKSNMDYEIGTPIGMDSNGEYKLMEDRLHFIGIITNRCEGKKMNTYKMSTTGIIPYSKVSQRQYSNLHKCDFSIADCLYHNITNGLPKINNIDGESQLGVFLHEGLLINYKENRGAETMKIPNEPIKKELDLSRGEYYRVKLETLQIKSLSLFETKGYSKVALINNSGKLFAELVVGRINVRVYAHNGDFILEPLDDLKVSTEIEITKTKFDENFISLHI